MVPKGRNDLPIACKGVARTSALNSRLPVITRVCRESRAIAFGRDADLTQPDGPSDLESRSQDWLERKTIPSTDIVHLNWTQRHKNHHETLRGEKSSSPWYQNDQIPEFIKVAAQCQRASIDANLLEIHFVIEDEPWYGGFFDDENGKTFDMLSCHKNYFVTLKMLNLHICMEDVLGSGLFGRLGEERVVLMGASDTTLIHRHYQLWMSGPAEDTEPKEIFGEILHTSPLQTKLQRWKYELSVYWPLYCQLREHESDGLDDAAMQGMWYPYVREDNGSISDTATWPGENWIGRFDEGNSFVRKSLEKMPEFEPVIMFRLCHLNCY